MPARKFGLYLSAINDPIVEKVKADYGYTKDSNAVNFIIQEYSRLTQEDKKEIAEVKEEVEKPTNNLLDWFVAEDKQ